MRVFTRRNGRRLLALGALAAAGAAVPATVAQPWESAVTAGSLAHSVANVIGGTLPPSCESTAPGRWRCAVPETTSRTVAEYRIRSSGRCWSGRRDRLGGRTLPRKVRGCVGMWDQLRLKDRL